MFIVKLKTIKQINTDNMVKYKINKINNKTIK